MSEEQAPNPAAGAAGAGGRRDTVWDDFLEMLKELPWGVGPTLVFLARRLGTRRFLLAMLLAAVFLGGIATGLGLVYFGAAPQRVVSENYRRSRQKADAASRKAPRDMKVVPLDDPKPDWLQPYVAWMEDEGQAQKAADPALRVGVGAVSHVLEGPTPEFVWALEASPGFEVDGRAFRMTAEGLFQPLEQIKTETSVYFEVPECEEKERLYAAVIARWKGDMPPVAIQATFDSVVKQGR